jgi:hypothetical protein
MPHVNHPIENNFLENIITQLGDNPEHEEDVSFCATLVTVWLHQTLITHIMDKSCCKLGDPDKNIDSKNTLRSIIDQLAKNQRTTEQWLLSELENIEQGGFTGLDASQKGKTLKEIDKISQNILDFTKKYPSVWPDVKLLPNPFQPAGGTPAEEEVDDPGFPAGQGQGPGSALNF